MTVESVLAHGLKTSVFGSQWNVEYGANLALLDPDRIKSDVLANRPAFGVAHRFFFATDNQRFYYDTGAAWVDITPAALAHAASHASGGADAVTLAQSQITNLVADLAGKEAANTNIQAHIASAANPHAITKTQVGLGSVDNTSDANKPVSSTVQTALNGKVGTTGNETIGGTKTFSSAGGVVATGVINGSSAAAGVVGEFLSSAVASVSFGASATYYDVTSIALTPGDWDISGMVWFYGVGVTGGQGIMGISTTSGNSGTGLTAGDTRADTYFSGVTSGATVAPFRVTISSNTTYYLKVHATYSAGSPQYSGRISARRVR